MSTKKASAKALQLAAEPVPLSIKNKKSRVSIYSPWADKMVRLDPYGRAAKRLYKYYINELGYDVSWIVPPDLRFYEQSESL